MRSCLPRTIYAFWFFSYWPPLHSSLCFKFSESQIACVYLGSPCERIQSVVAWSYALEQNIPVTDRDAWEEMGVPHLMTPMQSRHPGSQEAAEPLLEGTKSRYCSKEATPLSVYPQVIWISFPNSSFPALIHSTLRYSFCSECRQRIFSVASFRVQFAVSTTRWRNGNLAPSN